MQTPVTIHSITSGSFGSTELQKTKTAQLVSLIAVDRGQEPAAIVHLPHAYSESLSFSLSLSLSPPPLSLYHAKWGLAEHFVERVSS